MFDTDEVESEEEDQPILSRQKKRRVVVLSSDSEELSTKSHFKIHTQKRILNSADVFFLFCIATIQPKRFYRHGRQLRTRHHHTQTQRRRLRRQQQPQVRLLQIRFFIFFYFYDQVQLYMAGLCVFFFERVTTVTRTNSRD